MPKHIVDKVQPFTLLTEGERFPRRHYVLYCGQKCLINGNDHQVLACVVEGLNDAFNKGRQQMYDELTAGIKR